MLTKHFDIMEDGVIVEFWLDNKYHLIEFDKNHKKLAHYKWNLK